MKLVILLIAVLLFLLSCTTEQSATKTPASEPQPHLVEITSAGFSPKSISINAGDSVPWVNKDTNQHSPESAVHPTHTVYPGSSIEKCGSGEAIFDACKGLKKGESFTFTFTERGQWGYHDHLTVGFPGTVVVE